MRPGHVARLRPLKSSSILPVLAYPPPTTGPAKQFGPFSQFPVRAGIVFAFISVRREKPSRAGLANTPNAEDRTMATRSTRFPAPSTRNLLPLALSAATLALLPATAQAQFVNWNNATGAGAEYHTAANWVGGAAPGSTEYAQFNVAGTYPVWWNSTTPTTTPSVGRVMVNQGDVTFLNLDTTQHTFTVNGTGSGGAITDFLVLGTGSALTVSGLHVINQGGAFVGNGTTLTVDGTHTAGSKFTVNGTSGFRVDGTLNVSNGGFVDNVSGSSFLASFAGLPSPSAATVSGSQWYTQNLYVGGTDTTAGGTATLSISNSGQVDLPDSGVAKLWSGSTINLNGGSLTTGSFDNTSGGTFNFNDGTLTVNGASGTFTPWENFYRINGNTASAQPTLVITNGATAALPSFISIGETNKGNLTISGGSSVSLDDSGYIGLASGSTGVLTVTGSGSQFNQLSSSFYVGHEGNGTLSVADGGQVTTRDNTIGWASSATGAVTVTGSDSQLSTRQLDVGLNGSGTLNVSAGGRVNSDDGFVGISTGSTGVATVTGSGSQWNVTDELEVGLSGNGTLTVSAGGQVSSGSAGVGITSTGVATVTGSGSQWNNSDDFRIFTNGTLNITDGGALTTGSLRTDSLDNSAGGTLNLDGGSLTTGSFDNTSGGTFNFNDGTLTVNGASGTFSPWENFYRINGNTASAQPTLVITNGATAALPSFISIGETNKGNLTISGGSSVSLDDSGYIGLASGSTGVLTVTGSGSQFNQLSSSFYVGHEGNGTLSVADGGQVTTRDNTIGWASSATGAVTVTGSDSQLSTRQLDVGLNGSGTLNVSAGGRVNSDDGFVGISTGSTGVATVTGSGSQWNVTDELEVGLSGNGTLTVSAGGQVSSRSTGVGIRATSTGVVTVTGSGSQWNNSDDFRLFTNGTLNIADGGALTTGSLRTGSLDNSAGGTLNLNGGSLTTGSFDFSGSSDFSYSGTFNFNDGTLTVNGAGGTFAPGTAGFTIDGDDASALPTLVIAGGTSASLTGDLKVGNTNKGTLTLSGSGSVTTTAATTIASGSTLNIDGGSLTTGSFDNSANGTFNFNDGTLTVNGASGTFSPSENFYRINGNTALAEPTLVITNGATAAPQSSVRVGDTNKGNLTISGGGSMSLNDFGIIGSSSGSTGVVTVTGSGSQLNQSAESFFVGYDGNGTLSVADGGQVTTRDNTIGRASSATGVATVTGVGSQLNNPSYELNVGFNGSGTLNVMAGGQVNSEDAFIGIFAGSTGVVTVTGGGSQWNISDEFQLGLGGNGTLTVSAGGLVSSATASVGEISNAVATVTGSGSQWNNSGTFRIYANSTLNIADGGALRADGGVTNDGTMALNTTASVKGNIANNATGLITSSGGTATLFNDVVNNGEVRTDAGSVTVYNGSYSGTGSHTGTGTVRFEGGLKPGSSPAAISFAGDVLFGASLVSQFEFGGSLPGEFDQLDIAGDLMLAGTLQVDLINSFSPSLGQQFQILDVAGTLAGTFDGLNEGNLVGNFGGTDLFITYASGDGNDVSLVATLPGDFDLDFDVDGFDFLMWQRGQSPNPSSASDLNLWQDNYGATIPAPVAATAIPEPTSAVLSLVMVSLLWPASVRSLVRNRSEFS